MVSAGSISQSHQQRWQFCEPARRLCLSRNGHGESGTQNPSACFSAMARTTICGIAVGTNAPYDVKRDWHIQNIRLMEAMTKKGYDVNYTCGEWLRTARNNSAPATAGYHALDLARLPPLRRSRQQRGTLLPRSRDAVIIVARASCPCALCIRTGETPASHYLKYSSTFPSNPRAAPIPARPFDPPCPKINSSTAWNPSRGNDLDSACRRCACEQNGQVACACGDCRQRCPEPYMIIELCRSELPSTSFVSGPFFAGSSARCFAYHKSICFTFPINSGSLR